MLKCKEALAVGCPQCGQKVELDDIEAHYGECVTANLRFKCWRNCGASFNNKLDHDRHEGRCSGTQWWSGKAKGGSKHK